jgi:hypothetical protein
MAKKPAKMWVFSPPKAAKPAAPAGLKAEVEAKATALVSDYLKPQHVKPPPKDDRFNYIIDIGTKWHGNAFYFFSTYACPGPNALSPTFESRFARMEYIGMNRFSLSYMRHTGKWDEVLTGLTVEQCLKSIRDDPWFQP